LYKSAETGLLLDEDSQWITSKENGMSQIELDGKTKELLDRVRHSRKTSQWTHDRRAEV